MEDDHLKTLPASLVSKIIPRLKFGVHSRSRDGAIEGTFRKMQSLLKLNKKEPKKAEKEPAKLKAIDERCAALAAPPPAAATPEPDTGAACAFGTVCELLPERLELQQLPAGDEKGPDAGGVLLMKKEEPGVLVHSFVLFRDATIDAREDGDVEEEGESTPKQAHSSGRHPLEVRESVPEPAAGADKSTTQVRQIWTRYSRPCLLFYVQYLYGQRGRPKPALIPELIRMCLDLGMGQGGLGRTLLGHICFLLAKARWTDIFTIHKQALEDKEKLLGPLKDVLSDLDLKRSSASLEIILDVTRVILSSTDRKLVSGSSKKRALFSSLPDAEVALLQDQYGALVIELEEVSKRVIAEELAKVADEKPAEEPEVLEKQRASKVAAAVRRRRKEIIDERICGIVAGVISGTHPALSLTLSSSTSSLDDKDKPDLDFLTDASRLRSSCSARHQSHLHFCSRYDDIENGDVWLHVTDSPADVSSGVRLKVHRFALAFRSRFFRKILSKNPVSIVVAAKAEKSELPGVPAEVVVAMLRYIYTGDILDSGDREDPLTIVSLLRLVVFARRLGLINLATSCLCIIQSSVRRCNLPSLRRRYAAFLDADEGIKMLFSASLTSKLSMQFETKKEYRVLMLGLDATGKTTILYKLKLDENVVTIPTIGFKFVEYCFLVFSLTHHQNSVETIKHDGMELTVWDVSGSERLRQLWRHYYHNTNGIIFVVDSNDSERFALAKEVLETLNGEDEVKDVPILVFANKQDLPVAKSVGEIWPALGLPKMSEARHFFMQPCCAVTGEGLWEGIEWLIGEMEDHDDMFSFSI